MLTGGVCRDIGGGGAVHLNGSGGTARAAHRHDSRRRGGGVLPGQRVLGSEIFQHCTGSSDWERLQEF